MMFYIRHEDTQTPENGVAYFGPFEEDEIQDRLNDAYADALASFGEVECEQLLDTEIVKIYANPREYWMEQLSKMEKPVVPIVRGEYPAWNDPNQWL